MMPFRVYYPLQFDKMRNLTQSLLWLLNTMKLFVKPLKKSFLQNSFLFVFKLYSKYKKNLGI